MAITTGDGLIAAAKQGITHVRTASGTSVSAQWHTLWSLAGNPGAGSLTIGNTANGLVPTDATTGAPLINAFGGGATGYLAAVDFSNTIASRLELYDRLFHVGSVSLTSLATTTLASQPAYTSRIPGGTDYNGLEIWLEFNAAVSATATTVTVTYTNQAGTTGRSTGATASLSGFISGRILKLPLQAGDTGVQKIETIVVGGTVATTGSVNVIVARSLWSGRCRATNDGDLHGPDRTMMPVVYADSCLAVICAADSTSTGAVELLLTIANG